jgi:hypothetical protein
MSKSIIATGGIIAAAMANAVGQADDQPGASAPGLSPHPPEGLERNDGR